MTGPTGPSSSPDKAHAPSQPPPPGGSSSSGSGGAEGGAGAGGGGSSVSPSARTRPVTRSSAAMSSGKSTRQQQHGKNAAVASPTTPSGESKHRQTRQQPTTPKGAASSTSSTSRKGEASVTTPPPTAAASTSARSPETTARSTRSGESNTTPTPTSPANTTGGASHHYHTRHSQNQPASSTQQHQNQESVAGGNNPNTRKRSAAAASIDTTTGTSPSDGAEHDDPRIDRLSLTTPTTANTTATATSPASYRGSGGWGGGPDFICLCSKEPKVPRPRNAFILYRQFHQHETAAANPRTANPEISKIIGNKWKNEPEEVKQRWRNAADQEKHEHALRYPDYKYQPRRSKGKGGSETTVQTPVSATFPSGEGHGPGTCPKCGGRYISTPRTPSTPFAAGSSLSGRFSSGSIPTSGMSSTGPGPGRGPGGGDPWGDRRDGPPRRGDPRQSIDSAMGGVPDYYGHPPPPPPQYQYGPSAPGSTPYPHNYGPQQGGPPGGVYPPYPSNIERDFRERERERDRMINNRGWPAPGPPPPPLAYDQQPPHAFRDRLFDIREAEYEGGMTPVADSPSEPKRRRYNPDHYQRQEYQQPLPSPPPPPMGGYGGQPPPPPRQPPMDYGYGPQGPPPPPPMQLQAPQPRPNMRQESSGPSMAGPGPQQPLMGRSTPTMGPPPPPPHSRTGSVSVGATAPGYHSQPPPRPSGSTGGGRGGRGARGSAHGDTAEFESVRLPPIQTHLPRPGQSAGSSAGPHTAMSGGGSMGPGGPGSSANSPMDMDISSATPTGISMAGGLNISYGNRERDREHERDRTIVPRRESASLIDPALHPGGGVRKSAPPPLSKPAGPSNYPTSTATRPAPPPVTPIPASIPGPGSSQSHPLRTPRTEATEEKSAQGPMIMSIGYLHKLAQFERIINPLSNAFPYQQTMSGTTRGPIIAVEGTNMRLMKQVAGAVERALEQSGSFEVKKWLGPGHVSVVEEIEDPAEKDKAQKKTTAVASSGSEAEPEAVGSRRGSGTSAGEDDVLMVDAPGSAAAASAPGSSSASVAVSGNSAGGDDNGKPGSRTSSKTPTPAVAAPAPGSTAASTTASTPNPAAGDTASARDSQTPQAAGSRTGSMSSVNTQKSVHSTASKALSTTSTAQVTSMSIPQIWQELSTIWHTASLEMVAFVTNQTHLGPSSAGGTNKRKHSQTLTPVALLPHGYTLTHSNRHACLTPITDSYAPVDHWRWMASLWRGVVAPDLTIYVLDQKALEEYVGIEDELSPDIGPGMSRSHSHASPESVVSGGNGGQGLGQGQTVYFKRAGELRGTVLVVRLAGPGEELLGGTERRVGFEVNEWVNEWCSSGRRG